MLFQCLGSRTTGASSRKSSRRQCKVFTTMRPRNETSLSVAGVDVFVVAPTGMGKVFNFSRGVDTFLNIDRAYASRFLPLLRRYAFCRSWWLSMLIFISFISVAFPLSSRRYLVSQSLAEPRIQSWCAYKLWLRIVCKYTVHFASCYGYATDLEIEKLRSKAVPASALSSDTPKEEKNEVSMRHNLFRPWPHAKLDYGRSIIWGTDQ